MNNINLNNLTLHGELVTRANLNFTRLESEKYRPETIFDMDQHSWPADWEGRTILGLCMLSQTTGRTPLYLDEIIARIPERLNAKGYLGPVYDDGVTHEQAMSGHSWMLRGLIEYHNWKKDSAPAMAEIAMNCIKGIIAGLYIPQAENYKDYPTVDPDRYDDPRWILSHKQSKTKTHAGTSDCGCAFIAIDGATAAYELLGDERLIDLIEAMIGSYAILPREELFVQTHATLSGIRGILRYARITGDSKYLKLGRDTFELYKTKAWTEHYANYNWFGLPRWTEPCAIIDSFIISQELWEATGADEYLRDAHHILYNAIAHAQRSNGAFGTDLCVGAMVKPPKETGGTDSYECDQAILFAKALTYEVYWCCNMRGGDGLARAAMYSFFTEANCVIMPYFHTCEAKLELENGTLALNSKADYPASGTVTLNVKGNSAGLVTLKFFAPAEWTAGAESKVTLNGNPADIAYEKSFAIVTADLKSGDEIVFNSEMRFYISEGNCCINNSRDHFSFRHGPMMLGYKTVIENDADLPTEITLARDTDNIQHLGGARYEAVTTAGEVIELQPMWSKDNMIEPLDVFQLLFAK